LTKRKDEFKIEQKEDETILESFFNLEEKRRDEILQQMESSRKFDMPFPDLVTRARELLETMVVSHKPKDKLGIKVDEKTNKKQLKIRGALHEETYYGKLNGRDTKNMDISKLSVKDISKIIDGVLKEEIDNHRKKYESMKEAFTGEGLQTFNESRFQRKKPTELKPPVFKVKVWYSGNEDKKSTLLPLYGKEKKQNVVTGDNYLFLVLEIISSKGTERIFDIVSLYDSVSIAKNALKDNNANLKQEIVEARIAIIKSEHIEKLQEKINAAKNKKKLKQELLDWTDGNIQIKPFTLQQNELVYLPIDSDNSVSRMSDDEFQEWIANSENKKAFCKRIYKVVKFTGKDCFFIPHNYANSISVAKNLSEEEQKALKEKYDEKKIPQQEKNYEEFSSYGNCSTTEVGISFVQSIIQTRNYEEALKEVNAIRDKKDISKKEKEQLKAQYINSEKPLKIQDTCIKIQIDWLGNIKLI
jgi:hypothetical protein